MSIDPRSPILIRCCQRLREARYGHQLLVQPGDCGWASAPSNIALLKYWGKTDAVRQIPVGPSVSRTLGSFRSQTAVCVRGGFLPKPELRTWPRAHLFSLNGSENQAPPQKQESFINRFLAGWADDVDVEVRSTNNFPTGCGVASSASGYAALVGALTASLGVDRILGPVDTAHWLVEWSRLGSGSATRSALLAHEPDYRSGADAGSRLNGDGPFVAWSTERSDCAAHGQKPSDAPTCTYSVRSHPEMDDLEHLLFVVDGREKQVSSSAGHADAGTSLFQTVRVAGLAERFQSLVGALQAGDFDWVRAITEEDALSMHTVMATSRRPVVYMLPETVRVLKVFLEERRIHKWKAMWTLDAGPNVHFLVAKKDRLALEQLLRDAGESFSQPAAGRSEPSGVGFNQSRILYGAGSSGDAGLKMGTGDSPYGS